MKSIKLGISWGLTVAAGVTTYRLAEAFAEALLKRLFSKLEELVNENKEDDPADSTDDTDDANE